MSAWTSERNDTPGLHRDPDSSAPWERHAELELEAVNETTPTLERVEQIHPSPEENREATASLFHGTDPYICDVDRELIVYYNSKGENPNARGYMTMREMEELGAAGRSIGT